LKARFKPSDSDRFCEAAIADKTEAILKIVLAFSYASEN
jgi:hypothetical protein